MVSVLRVSSIFLILIFLTMTAKYITDDDLTNNPLTVAIFEGWVVFVEKIGMSEEQVKTRLVEHLGRGR